MNAKASDATMIKNRNVLFAMVRTLMSHTT